MKTLDLHHNALGDFPAKLHALRHRLALRNPIQLHLPKVEFHFNAESGKSLKTYLVGALSEGLKQNLLGAEIDMEFLILSIRTYSKVLFTLPANNIKQLSAGRSAESNDSYYQSTNTPLVN